MSDLAVHSVVNFRNAHKLFYGVWSPESVSEDIEEIFLLLPGKKLSKEALAGIQNTVREFSLRHKRVHMLDIVSVLRSKSSHIKGIYQIHAALRSHNSAVFFLQQAAEDSKFFLATALMGPPGHGLSAQKAVETISGIDASGSAIRRGKSFYSRAGFVQGSHDEGIGSLGQSKPRFTIRMKLLSITAVIVIASLTTVTLMASYFFKDTSEKMIQDYNLSLARLIGLKVQGDLRNAMSRSQQFANGGFRDADFFTENGAVIYVRSGDRIEWNERLLSQTTLSKTDLSGIPSGGGVVKRVEIGKISLLLLNSQGGAQQLTVCLQPAGLLEAFRSTRQTNSFQLFLVDAQGSALLNTDAKHSASTRELPIVKQMLSSPVDNGLQRYTYGGVEYIGAFKNLNYGGLGIVSTVEVDRVFEAVFQIQRINFKIAAIILAVAFMGVFFFSRTLSVPIVRLVSAMRGVEQGNFKTLIVPTTHDEVGILTASFLSMTKGLEEREKIKDAFGKFVHQEIADLAMKGEIKLGGEEKRIAIFFSDLRNFTGISEKLPPDRVVELMNQYFSEMVECVYEKHGLVDKFIGDAIMAHWGAFKQTGDDTKHAIDAAILMRERLLRLNKSLVSQGYPALRSGIGINTGDVIAGQIGSRRRLEYTVIGDAVNLASRIEFLNKAFGTDILVSEESMLAAGNSFKSIRLPPVQIRGKTEPQTVFAILGYADDPTAPDTLEELRAHVGIEFNAELAKRYLDAPSDRILTPGQKSS